MFEDIDDIKFEENITTKSAEDAKPRKIEDENECYEKQVIESNYKSIFKGKQYL